MRMEVRAPDHTFLSGRDELSRIYIACACGWSISALRTEPAEVLKLSELAAALDQHIADPLGGTL